MKNKRITVRETGATYLQSGDAKRVYRGVYKGYLVLAQYIFDKKGNRVGDITEYRKPEEVIVEEVI